MSLRYCKFKISTKSWNAFFKLLSTFNIFSFSFTFTTGTQKLERFIAVIIRYGNVITQIKEIGHTFSYNYNFTNINITQFVFNFLN